MDEVKVIRTFWDKVGIALFSSGLGFLMLGALLHASWYFSPVTAGPQINIVGLLGFVAISGLSLIRLSLYTVEKPSKNS